MDKNDSPIKSFTKATKTIVPSPSQALVFNTEKQRNAQFLDKGLSKPGRVSFEVLRRAVQSTHAARIIVNTLKEKVTKTKWVIKPKKQNTKISPEMQEQIDQVTDLLEHPNLNDQTFRTLLDMVLEDLLVLDVGCIEKTRYEDGTLAELHFCDASTIRPVYDEWGRQDIEIEMPTELGMVQAPVSFVQIMDNSMYGGPESGQIVAAWPKKDFIRFMQHPQGAMEGYGYGLSGIESVVSVVSNILNADNFNANYFEEGSFPPVIIQILGQVNQRDLQLYREYLMSELAGQYHRPAVMAGGNDLKVHNLKDLTNRDMEFMEYMKFMVRLLAAAYGLSGQDVGLTDDVGSKNVSETQRDITQEKGYSSILHLLKEVFNQEIIWKDFGFKDLEFDWVADDSLDPKEAADIFQLQLQSGVCTVNEARQKQGYEKYEEDWANQPMVLTTTGYIPIMASNPEEEGQDQDKEIGQDKQPDEKKPEGESKERLKDGNAGGEKIYRDQEKTPDDKGAVKEKSMEEEKLKVKKPVEVLSTRQPDRVEIKETKSRVEDAVYKPISRSVGQEITKPQNNSDIKAQLAGLKAQISDSSKKQEGVIRNIMDSIKMLIGKVTGQTPPAPIKTQNKPDFDENPAMFGTLILDDGLKNKVYKIFHDSDLNAAQKFGFNCATYKYNFENAKFDLVQKITANPDMYGGIIRSDDINGAKYIICVKKQ
jgi:phage portal protein BeeE